MHLRGVNRFIYGKDVKVQGPAEILAGWALPAMSEALAADEKEREALEFIEAIRKLNANKKKHEQERA